MKDNRRYVLVIETPKRSKRACGGMHFIAIYRCLAVVLAGMVALGLALHTWGDGI